MEERTRELVSLLADKHPRYKPSPVSVDSLLDTLVAVYEDCRRSPLSDDKSSSVHRFIAKYEKVVEDLKKIRVNSQDFTVLRCLAKGQFGEVFLVRNTADQKVYAMKTLRKSDMLKQADIAFFMEERHILAAIESEWLTQLMASFQDESNLYLVMEFVPGGDLATILMKADEGLLTIDESFARYYIAEIALALKDLHKLNFIHRDIKPGNILIDKDGHVKLTDFGSCVHLSKKDGVTSMVTVGTPDYISPEVLMSNEGKGTYGIECDFWSLGITLYEMLIGEPPFYADTLLETYNKIMNHKQFYSIPDDIKLSNQAMDLLGRLICDKSERIKSFEEFSRHPFFQGFDWSRARLGKPPFVPKLSSDDDVSNFPEVDEMAADSALSEKQPATRMHRRILSEARQFVGENLSFIGYTFFRHNKLLDESLFPPSPQQQRAILPENTSLPPGTAVKSPAPQAASGDKRESTHLPDALRETERLRSQLEGESKRIKELEYSRDRLQSELDQLRQSAGNKEKAVEERVEKVNSLERDLKLTKLDLADVQKKLKAVELERQNLLDRLTFSREEKEKTSADLTVANQNNGMLMNEQRKLLDQVEALNGQINDYRQKLQSLEQELKTSSKAKALAEVELNHLKRQMKQQQDEQNQFERALIDLEDQISKDSEARTELELKLVDREQLIGDLQKRLASVEQDLRDVEEYLRIANKRIEIVDGANLQLERQVASLTGKPAPTRTPPAATPASDKKSSIATTRQAHKSASVLDHPSRSTSSQSINALTGKVQAPHNSSTISTFPTATLQSKLDDVQSTIATHVKEIQTLRERSHSTASRASSVRSRGSIRGSFLGANEDLTNLRLERQVNDLQREKALTELEVADLRKRLTANETQRAAAEQKVKQLEQKLAEHSRQKFEADAKCQALQDQLNSTEDNLKSLKADMTQLTVTKTSQDSTMADLIKSNALLELKRDELNQKLTAAIAAKDELNVEHQRTRSRLNDFLNNRVDSKAFSSLTDECTQLNRKLKESQAKYESLQIAHIQICNEYSLIRSGTGTQLPSLSTETPQSAPSSSDVADSMIFPGDGGSSLYDYSKRPRNNNMARLKALEQKLDAEIAMRASAESQIAELRRRNQVMEMELEEMRRLGGDSYRSSSTVSSLGSVLNFRDHPSPRKLNIRSLFSADWGSNGSASSNNPFQGWLKVRLSHQQGKKGKYEWVKRFAVIKDNKFYLLDREKDKEAALEHMTPVIDIKNNFFLVRPVGHRELLHLNSKDALCVFTVEITSKNFSLESLQHHNNDTPSTAESQPKQVEGQKEQLEALEASIEKEEKFRLAAEKIIAVSNSGETQLRTKNELDECNRRLRLLKSELQSLQIDSSSPNSLKPQTPTAPKLASVSVENQASPTPRGPSSFVKSVTSLVYSPSRRQQKSPGSQHHQRNQSAYQHNGHSFISKQQEATATCYHCHDILFGVNQSVQCTQCQMICHKFCHTSVPVTCQEYMELRHARKWYLMAADESDRSRWICLLGNMSNALTSVAAMASSSYQNLSSSNQHLAAAGGSTTVSTAGLAVVQESSADEQQFMKRPSTVAM